MKPPIKRDWKFWEERINAILLLILMFTFFYQAYHATSDWPKGGFLAAGLLCFLTVIAMVFKDFDPNDTSR